MKMSYKGLEKGDYIKIKEKNIEGTVKDILYNHNGAVLEIKTDDGIVNVEVNREIEIEKQIDVLDFIKFYFSP